MPDENSPVQENNIGIVTGSTAGNATAPAVASMEDVAPSPLSVEAEEPVQTIVGLSTPAGLEEQAAASSFFVNQPAGGVVESPTAEPISQMDTSLVENMPEEQPSVDTDAEAPFEWIGSEPDMDRKSTLWYIVLTLVICGLLGTAIIIKQWLSMGVFIMMGVAIGVYAHRGAHSQSYRLDSTGLTIEGKFYSFNKFRSFSVIDDPRWMTIDLRSTDRFMPGLTILYNEIDLELISSRLSQHMPREDRNPDLIERATHWLKF